MKLFVWNNPYEVDAGQSLVFAVAETVEQAREIAKKGTVCTFGKPREDQAQPNVELGEPTRVVELPCAEWHMWAV
jgi:hypothetical protein